MTLFLLHGFTGSPRSWAPVLRRLPDPPSVLSPYIAGHGPDPVMARDFRQEVTRLADLMRERAPGPVHLAGYSMGARVALGMLAAYPGLFSAATLVAARNGLGDPAARRERAAWEARWIEALEREGLQAFLAEWEALPMWQTQRSADPALLDDQRDIRASHTAAGLVAATRALGLAAMPDLSHELAAVETPVTLLTGERDDKFTRLADDLARLLPRARRLTVADAGHNLLVERPGAVAEALKQGMHT